MNIPHKHIQPPSILAINGGSSSIKFALYRAGMQMQLERSICGQIDRIGLSGTRLTFSDGPERAHGGFGITARDHRSAIRLLIDWLEEQPEFSAIIAVGHRVVHGMAHTEPERITEALLDELYRIRPYDPEHLPRELDMIEAFRERFPELPQVACFDTAFHHTLPRVASMLPIPRRYDKKGVRRYGFHGLSYSYLMEELAGMAGAEAASGRVILAHLGNGASMAAVRSGKSLDTTMSFTPAGGLVMGSRSGDLDPGVAWHLIRTENLSPTEFNHLINHESGLLGISETSSDMRDLMAREGSDPRAAEAVALFCYQAKKWIGAYAAALGGLDTLVFAGGIGENAPDVRARICEGLEFIGIELDHPRNAANAGIISAGRSRATVRVMHTDEERMIVRTVCRLLELPMEQGV